MTIEEAREYWHRRLERAENYSDEHWDAEERHAHSDYVDAMKYAINALTVCVEHKKLKSNGDRIRAMSDAQLVEFIVTALSAKAIECDYCIHRDEVCRNKRPSRRCAAGMIEWLRSEVRNE